MIEVRLQTFKIVFSGGIEIVSSEVRNIIRIGYYVFCRLTRFLHKPGGPCIEPTAMR